MDLIKKQISAWSSSPIQIEIVWDSFVILHWKKQGPSFQSVSCLFSCICLLEYKLQTRSWYMPICEWRVFVIEMIGALIKCAGD
jgi:hypothetical protein